MLIWRVAGATPDALVIVPGPIASSQFVSKDPDSVMVVTPAFFSEAESGSAGGDHHAHLRASSRNF